MGKIWRAIEYLMIQNCCYFFLKQIMLQIPKSVAEKQEAEQSFQQYARLEQI